MMTPKIVYNNLKQAEIKYQILIHKLYSSSLKPSIANLSQANLRLSVEVNSELMAMACLYKNAHFPEYLMIANYESVNNQEIVALLFQEINKYAIAYNYKLLLGPININTWHSYRFSTLKNKPFFMEMIHLNYYPDQWLNEGFTVYADYHTNIKTLNSLNIIKSSENFFIQSKQLVFRNFNPLNTQIELELIHDFCTTVFAKNILFSPLSLPDFIKLYQPLLPVLNSELIEFVLDNDKLVALLFAIKDYYNPKQVIVKTIARNPSDKYKGLVDCLVNRFEKKALAMGFESVIHAYMFVDNKSTRASENHGGELYQKHVLLNKRVQ